MSDTIINAPANTPFIEVIRDFDATPEQLFRVSTDPDLIAQWLGPNGLEMEVVEYDARPGGRYRYIHREPSGAEYAFRGVFHAVEPGALVIQTFEYEGLPGEVSLEKATYTATDNGVRLRTWSVFGSVQARDTMVASGMESGLNDAMEKLTALVAKETGR
ncbi:Activator of Hsp90 ATPase 1 family protein [Kribbella flavida DSM 17836]|uniref:Activator of Hsp90 ATPase 1 family protein n=1 Tax=Kribbella flavida (strain DSM 17836 / JCM 10339 / NBRC 14399) TaxID=479435 RepID=D2PRP8_KRIFD|nr:SRPBCC family protein [Kribbella flavida]ADB34966.1 Activator of Hsp90 ATPase 1 family protein [Kribbella flavida DSM 17836]